MTQPSVAVYSRGMTKKELELVFASILGTLLVVLAVVAAIYRFYPEYRLDKPKPTPVPTQGWEHYLDHQTTPSATPLQEATASATIE